MLILGTTDVERIAYCLGEAQTLRRIARLISLNRDRETVLRAAIEYEQMAAELQKARPATDGQHKSI